MIVENYYSEDLEDIIFTPEESDKDNTIENMLWWMDNYGYEYIDGDYNTWCDYEYPDNHHMCKCCEHLKECFYISSMKCGDDYSELIQEDEEDL